MSKKTVFLLALSVLLAGMAEAATAPTSSALLYNLYDIFVLQGIAGAPGYVIGAGLVGYGLARLGGGGSVMATAMSLLGGAGFLLTPSIVESLGALY